jgi:hypothetical protein
MIIINLDDVESAISEFAEQSDEYASGLIGQSFSTRETKKSGRI